MIETLSAVGKFLFAWVVITGGLSWLLAWSYPVFARLLHAVRPAESAALLVGYALLAPATGLLVVLVLSLPLLAFPLVASHCHDIVCAPHRLVMATETPWGVTAVVVALACLGGGGVLMLRQLLRSQRRLLTLAQLSGTAAAPYRLIDSNAHIAWCTGLFRPQIYLSTGLLRDMSAAQIRAILAHEASHASRRDNLRKWCLHWATVAWPSARRQAVARALSSCHEQLADLAAVRASQTELTTQAAMETLAQCHTNWASEAETPSDIQMRMRALNAAWDTRGSDWARLRAGIFMVALWLVAVTAAIHFGHPLLEWLSR